MSLLRDRDWKLKYTPDDGNLLSSFYVPALSTAVRYDRLTGYFSATALSAAARGVEGLIVNDGRMRLIAGCTLGDPEVEAIERGERLREAVERSLMATPDLSGTPGQEEALELVAWMVATERLDVRIAVRCDSERRPVSSTAIFHEKSGVIEDRTGDRIAFTGSANETAQGWTANWEGLSVYTDWEDERRVRLEEENFAQLWADKARNYRTIGVPAAVRAELMRHVPPEGELPERLKHHDTQLPPEGPTRPAVGTDPSPTPLEERRKDFWERVATAALDPVGGDQVGEATCAIRPWPHQVRAFHRMYDNWPPKLLIADEVGLGKTIQAGLILRQAWLAGRVNRVLVLAPASVCRQWQIELREKFNLDWPLYDGKQLTWATSHARKQPVDRQVSRSDWHREPFVIMSSHLARRHERQAELLEAAEPWDLIVLDEAHHARRRGAGSVSEEGPNQLLRLMLRLKDRTNGLIMLTATPMQVAPVELWDLLNLLGLPDEWHKEAFEGFFRDLSSPGLTNDKLDRLAALYRASEAAFGELSREDAKKLTGLSPLRSKKVLDALRDGSRIPRRQLNEEQRKAALKLIRQASPVKALVSRHTRELLRHYHHAGKLSTPIATRQVEDRFIELSPEERAVYNRVETYISETYNAADKSVRSAVGFVMTIYRRRLASSFYALRQTLEKRRDRLGGSQDEVIELYLEESIADVVDAGEEIDLESAQEQTRKARMAEETDAIGVLLEHIRRLPIDTKAQSLVEELKNLESAGYRQTIVFTQFTDTLDFLRDYVAELSDRRVMCFSGRGGEIRERDGRWRMVTREKARRHFREGKADVLIATDAAAEGLNFQFCGALVNYDLPWNPMRVEQRIGRIDRLGQQFGTIRILNLHYSNTVEADVYHALRSRIDVFHKVVGGLQPILTRLPELIEGMVLSGANRDEASLDTTLAQEIEVAGQNSLDIDLLTEGDLDLAPRAPPALTLADLRRALEDPDLLPPGTDASPMDGRDFRLVSGEWAGPVRVTLDRDLYEDHADDMEFWSPGNPTFPDAKRKV